MQGDWVQGYPAFLAAVGVGLALINTVTWMVFVADKKRAVRKEWRVRESTLLWLAAAGGWPAAKLAQRRLRHKSYKQPFRSRLNAVGLVPAVLAVAVLAPPFLPQGTRDRLIQVVQAAAQSVVAATASSDDSEERPLPRRFGPGSGD